MTVVVDASVVIKWLLQDPQREAGTETATRLMEQITQGAQAILQPPHWLAEVGVVLGERVQILPSTMSLCYRPWNYRPLTIP